MKLRYVKPSDAPLLHAAFGLVAREGRFLARESARPLREDRELIDRQLEDGAPYYVLEERGKICGWIVVRLGRRARSHVGTLGMGVLKAHRGKGLGKRLMRRALDHAWTKSGLTKVELEVLSDNLPALHLYLDCGFEVEGTKRSALRVGDQLKDAVQMGLFRKGEQ